MIDELPFLPGLQRAGGRLGTVADLPVEHEG